MKKRKELESALDELMPVDDLPGMALYFKILRTVGDVIGVYVKVDKAVTRAIFPRYMWVGQDLMTYIMALAPISAVTALWFVPRLIALALRKVRRPGYYEQEKARRQALAHERRSTRKRTTLNPIPTPEALLAQFGRIRHNPREMLVFGSMLEDLEAYVDNSLVRDPDGVIVGRNGGIKQWLRENCAELGKRYHTVMRYKALAKRFKQAIDLEDPVPVSYAIAAAEAPIEVIAGSPAEVTTDTTGAVVADGLDAVAADTPGGVDKGGTTDSQIRCGQISAGHGCRGDGEMQLRCGLNYEVADDKGPRRLQAEHDRAHADGKRAVETQCVVEAVTQERFDILLGSAYVADGCRRLTRILAAGQYAKAFLDRCQATKKNLDERLAMLLEPDLIPASKRSPRQSGSITALA